MRIDITKKHENNLLGRQEVDFIVKESSTTPSRKELREKIAALLGANEKHLVVDVYDTTFGTSEVKGTARVYKDENNMKKSELEYVVSRNFGKPEKPKAAEAETAPAAPPAKK